MAAKPGAFSPDMKACKEGNLFMRMKLIFVPVLIPLILAGCASISSISRITPADRRLAERGEVAVNLAWGTPANEIANMIVYDSQKNLIPMLKGETRGTPEQLDFARRQITAVAAVCEEGPTWPNPPHFVIPHTPSAPAIDGKTDESAWRKAAIFSIIYPFNEQKAAPEPKTIFRMLWNEKYLFFAFECSDEDVQAENVERDGPVWDWDCVEIFLLPEFQSGLYWEINTTPAGSIYDALNAKKFKGWGGLARPELTVKGMQIACNVNGTLNCSDDKDVGYTVEVAVPFRQIPSYMRGNKPRQGDKLYLMLIRIDRNADGIRNYAFTPLLNWRHNIWNHAQAELGR